VSKIWKADESLGGHRFKISELLKKLPKDIVLLNWEYEQNGKNIYRTKELAKAKLSFMVCPGTSGWLTHGSRLSNSMANVTNFAEQGRKYGAQGLLNTDWGDNGHRNFLGVSLHSFAHGAAHSWNGKAVNNKKFTENFCDNFFHQPGLAEIIKTLGNNYRTCGTNVPNKSWLYFALVEPVKNIGSDSYINLMNEKGLKKIIEFSSGRYIGLPLHTEKFEKIAYEEIELAIRMDSLAAQRALVIKNEKYAELRGMKKQIQKMTDDFKRLWLLRNKVSRLNDNLQLFRKICE
jgi:hexosaminidase